jgi:hypothetical protein
MSTVKHRSYRKILNIEYDHTTIAGQEVPVTSVLWCVPKSTTLRTIKTDHIMFNIYVGSCACVGTAGWLPRKPVSINLKNPLASKFFQDLGERAIERVHQDAFNKAWTAYILSRPELSVGLKGTVSWFDRDGGRGSVIVPSLNLYFPVYACNIIGKKTWYPETACMYLEKGQEIALDLTGDCGQLFVSNVQGGHFDAEKWGRLDHSRLAFKCDESGKAINGLFGG